LLTTRSSNSQRHRGTKFRIWATERLRGYLIKGFVMDDERLKNPPVDGIGVPDYFDELRERIRDIRASEKRVYLRVREGLPAHFSTGIQRLLVERGEELGHNVVHSAVSAGAAHLGGLPPTSRPRLRVPSGAL
jgi:hypothetical protein